MGTRYRVAAGTRCMVRKADTPWMDFVTTKELVFDTAEQAGTLAWWFRSGDWLIRVECKDIHLLGGTPPEPLPLPPAPPPPRPTRRQPRGRRGWGRSRWAGRVAYYRNAY